MRHLNLRHFESLALRFIIAVAVSFASPAHARKKSEPVSSEALRQAQAQRKQKKHRTARELFNSVDPDVDLTLDAGTSRLNIGIGYNYSVSPSYQSGLYSRIDRWHPDVALNLLPGIEAIGGGEITLVRQFKSKREAIHAKPSLPLSRLPFSSESALAMDPGTIMMIPVRLQVFKGAEGRSSFGSPVSVYARAGHADRGEFQVQIQRLAGGKVRLRVLGTRQHDFEIEAGLRTGVLPFGKRIARVGKSRGSKNLVASEYVFDLANPDSAQAYNTIFREGRLRPNVALANPYMSTETLAREIREGFSPVDRIVSEDASKPSAERRITQSFRSVQTSTPTETRAEVDLFGFAGIRRTTSFSRDARLSYDDENNVHHTTLAPTAESRKRVRLLFGLRNEEEIRRSSLIARTAEDGSPIGTGEYVVTMELKDKRMGRSETDKARVKLSRLIAPSILADLKIEPILTRTAYKNARIYSQVVFTEQAFARIQGLTAAEIETSLRSYLGRVQSSFSDHDRAIRKSSEVLAAALDPRAQPSEKIDKFADLQKESLFRELGSGFLMSLLPEADLPDLVSVYVRVDAATFGAKPVIARYGHSDFKDLERATQCAGYQQDRSTIDLRMEDLCAGTSDTSTAPIAPLPIMIAPRAVR